MVFARWERAQILFSRSSAVFRVRLVGVLKVPRAITWIAPSSDPRRHAFPDERSDLRQATMKP